MFLLCVELPELGVHLLLLKLRVKLPTFFNQLLLTLNLRAIGVENAIFFAKFVRCCFEALVHAAIDLSLALSLAFLLEVLHTIEHFLADLLWRLEVILELFFVHLFLCRKHSSEFMTALLQIGLFALLHVGNT